LAVINVYYADMLTRYPLLRLMLWVVVSAATRRQQHTVWVFDI
jgi:hypothetical protein